MSALSRLSEVLNKSIRTIATVDTVNSNGTTTVIHNDSSKSTVLGDSVATGKVYIKDGVIISQAADLPYTEFEV